MNKDVRLNVTKFLASEYYPGSVGLKLTHDGIPCRLRGLIPLLRSKDPGFIRFLMTVLMALRRITVPPQPDIDSIKNPYTGTVDQDFARQYVKGFRRNLRKLKIYPKQLRG